ncbi:MAG TPA: MBL fold metallo-hydrolase [Verrucomicrobiae bacterium]|nr:MBL fold metallo-hydrolase [Verrucomicrobiae bacterium]
MHSFSLRCFGVGDGWPCADRNHSAFLYRFGKVTLLIDCGEAVSGAFKATGLNYDTIDRILVSHLHCDHIGGFFMLMQGFWLEQRQRDLPVHMPAEGIGPVRAMLNAACIFDELYAFRLFFEPLALGQPVVTQNVRVTPFRSSHLDSLRESFQAKYPQEFAAYCFLLESDRLRVGHSADIGAPEDLAPLVEQPLDLLVCELAHFKPKDLFAYLKGRPIKRIIFVHVARQYWECLEETRALAERMLGGIPFTFAHDGEEILL